MLMRFIQGRPSNLERGRYDAAWLARIYALWLGMACAAVLVSHGDPGLSAVIAGFGVLAVLAHQPVLVVVPLGIAVVGDPAVFPWVVAAAALTRETPALVTRPTLDGDLQRQLMRSRRRNEAAQVLVADGRLGDDVRLLEVVGTLRVTDGFEVLTSNGRCEVRAVLDGGDIDREAVEQRIAEVFGDALVHFGWASFPAQGVTLDALLTEARASMRPAHVGPVPELGQMPLRHLVTTEGSMAEAG